MDTHVVSQPDLAVGESAVSARLPGEFEYGRLDHTARLSADAPSTQPADAAPVSPAPPVLRPKPRRSLFAGVAIAALLGAAGGGAFLISPYNTLYPLPGLNGAVRNAAASVGVPLPAVFSPSAALAKVNVPPRPDVTRDVQAYRPKGEQMAELLALHPTTSSEPGAVSDLASSVEVAGTAAASPRSPQTTQPGANGVNPVKGEVPREPGSSAVVTGPPPTPKSTVGGDAATVSAAAVAFAPAVPPQTGLPSGNPSLPPAQAGEPFAGAAGEGLPATPAAPDAAALARDLHPGSMTSADEVQVLDLVTQIGVMVKDLSRQDAQLRAEVAKAASRTDARLRDYERRLGLAEARRSLIGARDALQAADDPSAALASVSVKPAQAPQAAPLSPSVVRAVAVVPQAPAPAAAGGIKLYRVQAASPGLALLAQVDRGGGEGAQMQVVVGDNIPDYGKVKSIAQKGTAWVVLTEHGPIASQ